MKLENAESSLMFMQEQHSRTLEGLHLEIQRLQQKNASECRSLREERGGRERGREGKMKEGRRWG